ncbi:transcriptional regulator, TetR family [Cyclonatronum proteinivorum]|uniref:Transcriptional regulator, TetR family n=1 Tax=Cyclonatronum proteinivorum TaxID=1457365 RepID=A0A345UH94_9BACT|nr:TetR/AcrR family transcriptional regulator [Cyclonatronum proteinivorum]AXI99845.1 transcriptional regulator, TetR family [Cyclonatronum proteinivorum]
MSTTERKKREREKRKQVILNATQRLITERGFESVTMDEIAVASEVSKGTLYLYFKSKSEIALALHGIGMQAMLKKLAELIAASGSGLEIIQKMGRLLVDFVRDNPPFFKCIVYLESIGIESYKQLKGTDTFEALQTLDESLFNYIRRAVQIGIQDGSIDATYKPELLTLQIMATARGLMQFIIFRDAGLFLVAGLEAANITLEHLMDDYSALLVRALNPKH